MNHLVSTARHLEEQINDEIGENQTRLELVLSRKLLGTGLEGLLSRGDAQERENIYGILEEVMATVPVFESIAILDTLGRTVMKHGSKDSAMEGRDEVFQRGKQGVSIDLWAPHENGFSLHLSGPIVVRGQVLGVAVVRAKGVELERLAEYPRLSGWDIEPFLVSMKSDSSLSFVFPSGKAAPGSPEQARVSTRLIRGRRDTLLSDYRDHRGVPVLAAIRFMESSDWGLVVKVDQALAYAPIRRFRNQTLMALAVVALLSILLSLAVSRRLARPILHLNKLAKDFSTGNLARRASSRWKGELGELGRSLNAMAENLAASQQQLEGTVEERTRELHKEIDDRRRAEAAMAASRKELQQHIDQMSTLTAKLGLDGRVLMANRACIFATGRSESEIIGHDFREGPWFSYNREVEDRMREAFEEAKAGKTVNCEEALLVRGRVQHVSVTFSPVKDGGGRVDYIVAEARDITALKEAQAALYEVNESLEDSVRERTESLRAALREKDLLLKEVHHRVKNNLQIISSLLSLQSVHVRDPQVAGVLMESRNRVKSMALVHERLYAGEDLGKVGFSGYIRDLAAQLVRSSEAASRDVLLQFDMEEVSVGLSQAIPCGLTIHELVANSLKHAFPEGRSGTGMPPQVVIRCRPLPLGGIEFQVEDNGVGVPEGFEVKKSRTLGLQLVLTLVRQLKGGLEMDRINGTRFRVTVPPAEEKDGEHGV